MKGKRLFISALGCALLLAGVRARAEIPVESEALQFILSQTEEGQVLSQELSSATDSQELEELRARLARVDQLFSEYRSARFADSDGELGGLDGRDELVLRELASRELRLQTDAEGKPEFVDTEALSPEARARTSFLAADSAADETPEGRAAGERQAKGFLREMRDCVRNMPPGAARKNNLRYMLINLGISQTMTLGGYVVGSGSKKVDWKNLPSDMIVDALSSFVGTKMVMGNGSFLVRWVRMAGFRVGRSSFDAVVYYINPLKNTHGEGVGEATKNRLEYNVAWGLSTSVLPVTLYSLFSGLECMYPGGKMVVGTTAARMAVSAGTSVLYFTLRNHVLGSGSGK